MKAFFAIVYELCLDGEHVAKDDPLYETSYIGQAGRYASSAEEALEMRWYEHQRKAKSDPKEYGLKWALNKYGPEAFTRRVICFLKFASRCIEALDYMNAVEIEEIDCRGGIMKDIAPPAPVWQTFNLKIGGQGDPCGKFESLLANEASAWQHFQEKVLELVAETGTCRCRTDYISKCGYGVGQALAQVRTQRNFLVGVENVEEREKWLERLPGWTWTVRVEMDSNSWQLFQRELLRHVEEFGTGYVTSTYVSPSGYNLYNFTKDIRSKGTFLRGDQAKERTDWLNSLPGWVWNAEAESRRLQGITRSKRFRDDPAWKEAQMAKMMDTKTRKREEHWATLNEVELAEAKKKFERGLKYTARKRAKREAKARGEAPEPKKPLMTKAETQLRAIEKRKVDIAALRATLVPEAKWHELSRYRKDGTVAKAHQILRERSVDAGV